MCCGNRKKSFPVLLYSRPDHFIKKARAVYVEWTENEIEKSQCQKYRQYVLWKVMRKGGQEEGHQEVELEQE